MRRSLTPTRGKQDLLKDLSRILKNVLTHILN